MNSKFQSYEKININKIFFEDSFIDLINKLSKTIFDYYHQTISLLSKSSTIIPLFENISQNLLLNENTNNNLYFNNNQELSKSITNINSIKKEFKSIAIKSEENLKIFLEKAKIIFKEMKEKKNNRIEEIYNDYANKSNPKLNEKNNEIKIGNVEPFRLSNLSKISTNSQKKERNKTTNKNCLNNKINTSNNFLLIKNLINKMSEYNDIIRNYSNESKENYIKLQKQLLIEINKHLNSNLSKSVEKRNIIKPNNIPNFNTNLNNNGNPFIMVNNNNNNVTLTTTNNNSYYNIIDKDNLKELKNKDSIRNSKIENYINNNNDLKKEINILNSQLEELINKNKILEKKLEESYNNKEMFNKNEKNIFDTYNFDIERKMKSLEYPDNEFKKESLLLIKDSKEKEKKNNQNEISGLEYLNQIKKLKEEIEINKNEYELTIKKLNEEFNNDKKENEQKLKQLNNENTSLLNHLADKNREIQLLQNSNKLKINELNKLKLIVKNNEKQLKIKKLKAEQQKANSPDNLKIKDILALNSRKNNDNNDSNNNTPNISMNNENNSNNKEIISKLESEIAQLKEELEKRKEEKESLSSNISILEKDISDNLNKNKLLENELINKNIEIEDENKLIEELKSEKEKLIQKLKEYKNIEELNLSQIKILKNHIKEMEKHQNIIESDSHNKKPTKKKELKKRISELEIENINIKMQLDIEINNNGHLKNEVKYKTEQIEGLNIVINKLMAEKELNALGKITSLDKNNDNTLDKNNYINLNNINRSKTKGEKDKINKISNKELNIKHIISNDNSSNTENNLGKSLKRQNVFNKKEYKTSKKLETFNLIENNSKKMENDATKSEDAKLEFNKNKI